MTINMTIHGAPRTKKNSSQIWRKANGVAFIAPSPYYKEYAGVFLRQVNKDHKLVLDMPVNVRCVYYMPTRRLVDLVGLLQATDDLLVKGRVLKDDNSKIIASHDGSRVRYDKLDPRVEIEIKPKVEGNYGAD